MHCDKDNLVRQQPGGRALCSCVGPSAQGAGRWAAKGCRGASPPATGPGCAQLTTWAQAAPRPLALRCVFPALVPGTGRLRVGP